MFLEARLSGFTQGRQASFRLPPAPERNPRPSSAPDREVGK